MKRSSLFFDFNQNIFNINMIYNTHTLNIFCDASYKSKNRLACYGVVATCMDDIIDYRYKLVSNTSSNGGELRGFRCAIDLALRHINEYEYINIFCDSQFSILGVRDYYFTWKYINGSLINSQNKEAALQEIFNECQNMIYQSGIYTKLKLFYQPGHVGTSFGNLNNAIKKFKNGNYLKCNIDINLMRYISTYNNYVDQNSRSFLNRSDFSKKYVDPVKFVPLNKINIY